MFSAEPTRPLNIRLVWAWNCSTLKVPVSGVIGRAGGYFQMSKKIKKTLRKFEELGDFFFEIWIGCNTKLPNCNLLKNIPQKSIYRIYPKIYQKKFVNKIYPEKSISKTYQQNLSKKSNKNLSKNMKIGEIFFWKQDWLQHKTFLFKKESTRRKPRSTLKYICHFKNYIQKVIKTCE